MCIRTLKNSSNTIHYNARKMCYKSSEEEEATRAVSQSKKSGPHTIQSFTISCLALQKFIERKQLNK
jgi:hypothetical protein